MKYEHSKRRVTVFAALAVSALALVACGSDTKSSSSTAAPTTAATATTGAASTTTGSSADSSATTAAPGTTGAAGSTPASGSKPKIVVGSADFPENQLLMEIYGQQLEKAGYTVDRKPSIGAREVYYKAISATPPEIDLVPEYTNSLLSYVIRLKDPNATPTAKNIAEQVTALQAALPSNLVVGTPSTAEDKDVIVCTSAIASKYSLKTLSDLAKVADQITIGAPPEFETRSPFGLVGFKTLYNATFKDFVPLKIGDIPAALTANEVDCGNLFSTMSVITTNNFVALDDDKTIVPNEAVLPLMTKDIATPEVLTVVNGVSSKLDTDMLKKLMVEIEVDKKAPDVVAKEFVATLPAP
ncbi:MAG: Substrate-binding region of ABC-type glycine betaine transport system [Ilumatobacteraceae bacterium]|nr:Substrate-binding region of ABC-type glycine betaine transport system [Ilumatobacteraceae bacterium]